MERPQPLQHAKGTPYKKMSPGQKVKFILKLIVCISTFGMAFPNVMSE
jgi:hypothetical protein